MRFVYALAACFAAHAGYADEAHAGKNCNIRPTGKASWYGPNVGSKTASGERFNRHGLTAAHRTLPFGSRVGVTDVRTGKQVVVQINDRGPFVRGRIIDLAEGAARKLGVKGRGVTGVRLAVLRCGR